MKDFNLKQKANNCLTVRCNNQTVIKVCFNEPFS